MPLFGKKGRRSKNIFASSSRSKRQSVVRSGLPAIGSTPITFGSSAGARKSERAGGLKRSDRGFGSSVGGVGNLNGFDSGFSKKRVGSGGYSYRRRGSSKKKFAVAAALVLVVVAAVAGVKFFDPFGDSSEEVVVNTGGMTGAVKKATLASATERVDENGLVHGVTTDGVKYVVYGRGELCAADGKVSFAAVGDQIGTTQAIELSDSYLGEVGDGLYDFWPFYQEIAPIIECFDLSYINQETVMAGTEEFGYSGYPTFNTPEEAAEAISDVGFDLVGFGSNHVFDLGEYGAAETHKVWNQYPELLVTGSYESQEARDTVQLIERGGATIAILQYCYGDNYLGTYENFPNTYHLAGFDKETMEAEIKRAQSLANAVIIVMHAGTEYVSEPNDLQEEYAQFFAELDVDLVIGSHAHITQPIKYVTSSTGKSVPVVYGMSDIATGWDKIDTIMNGIFTCDFEFEGEDARVTNLAWHPAIEWSDGGQTRTRLLADMSQETVNANVRIGNYEGDYYAYIKDFYANLDMEVPVVWKEGYLQSAVQGDLNDTEYALKRVLDRMLSVGDFALVEHAS